MKKYEIESLLKSFFIFFLLQLILLTVIILQGYQQGKHSIDDQIRTEMKICSFDLKCDGLELDFVEKTKERKVRKLYKDGDIYSFFEVPTEDGYLLKVLLPQKEYHKRLSMLKKSLFGEFIWYSIIIAILSFLFSIYALRPLKKALDMNEEFVKDILHDINTPLSSMVINFKLFKKEIGENRKIERMEHSVSTILSLQENLKTFLENSNLQKEAFSLLIMIENRVTYFQGLYPSVTFQQNVQDIRLETNKEAMKRVLDNLISNACKYSPKDATIKIYMKNSVLHIQDNGQGIKNVKKVFERYYKENDRGLGIGMHIVKKLCDSLHLPIMIESKVGEGTTIMIDLKEVIVK